MGIQNKINKLREQIHYHNKLYYEQDLPEISDYEYDQLMKELQKLENENPEFKDENSPTQKVGGESTEKFKQVTHKYSIL